MFSKELENLIQATLEDGVLEEYEKAALLKRAQAEGVDPTELQIYINSILQKRQRERAEAEDAKQAEIDRKKKEAVGRICPKCQRPVPPMTIKCQCGYEFVDTNRLSSVQILFEKLDSITLTEAEEEGILIPYASAHGNTKEAALFMAELLEKAGQKVIPMDLNREDMAKAVENAFRYDRMILAAITYDGALFPAMEDFLYHLEIKNFQKRKVGIIENGSWGPLAGKKMREHLESMKEIEIVEPVVTIRTRRQSKDQAQFEALRDAML